MKGKRTWAWVAGGFGVAAVTRELVRRRGRTAAEDEAALTLAPESAAEVEPDPRAEELRSKLDEAKAAGTDRDDFDAGETPVDADPDERRRSVHETGRAALDEMQGPTTAE